MAAAKKPTALATDKPADADPQPTHAGHHTAHTDSHKGAKPSFEDRLTAIEKGLAAHGFDFAGKPAEAPAAEEPAAETDADKLAA